MQWLACYEHSHAAVQNVLVELTLGQAAERLALFSIAVAAWVFVSSWNIALTA